MKKIDILLLILFPICAAILSVVFKANYLTSTLLFFGPLALWLSYRTPKQIARSLVFTFSFGLPMVLVADYFLVSNKAWFIPVTFFPRILGVIDIESLIWGLLWVYSVVIFYEHFLDKGNRQIYDKRVKYLIYIFSLLLLFVLASITWLPQILKFEYSYFWLGMLGGGVPLTAFLIKFPHLFNKFLKVTGYFFSLILLNEFVALHLNQWQFPTDTKYIGWVELFGYRIAFEEIFFLMIIVTMSILCYYEFFDDDRK